ncbi:MAG TPA: GTP cyclohydrolase I FolE [Parachlamydiaceae bacterium]|nr:GTP cyclohydrolase I FolE [Parachlamydiaceae bacterium]
MYDDLLLDISPAQSRYLGPDVIEKATVTNFPSPVSKTASSVTKQEKIELIAEKFGDIMEILGLDLTDDSLKHTPNRVAKMYVEEIFSGLDPSTFPEVSFFEDLFKHGQRSNMVFVKVNFCSFCEHHFVPMSGTAYIAYLPSDKLIGLSSIPRVVRFFARKPQVQERLTAQIADSLSILTGSAHVAVSLRAEHQCMIARGIESEHSYVITNSLRGEFDTNADLRKEFFDSMLVS